MEWPPDDEDLQVARSGWPPGGKYLEDARSPIVDLADVVARLQKEVEEFRAESGYRSDSHSDLRLVRVYVNASTHVCGKVSLGPISAGV